MASRPHKDKQLLGDVNGRASVIQGVPQQQIAAGSGLQAAAPTCLFAEAGRGGIVRAKALGIAISTPKAYLAGK